MELKFNPCAVTPSAKLLVAIKRVIEGSEVNNEASYITLNFRDSSYSCDEGGYHPVEIALQKEASTNRWDILYITDFSYHGFPYAELVKDLDFDFQSDSFSAVYCAPRGIGLKSVKEIYRLWEFNFLSYLEYGAYDQIKATVE